MAPSNPVRIVDENGRAISGDNPLAVDAQVNMDDVNIDLEGVSTEAKQDTQIANQGTIISNQGTQIARLESLLDEISVVAAVFGRQYEDGYGEIDETDSGSKEIVAPPGNGIYLAICSLAIVNTGLDAIVTVKFGTDERMTFPVSEDNSFSIDLPPFRELIGGDNEALVIDVSEDGPWHYWVQWREETI